MSQRDIITNQQKIVQFFSSDDIKDTLADENHRQVLHFLFKGPLTVEELEVAFKKSGNDKSDKSIYRYLSKLKKTGLVIEAGKRFLSDTENQIKTQTLFSRVSKIIFAPLGVFGPEEELRSKSLEIVNLIFQERMNFKNSADKACLKEKIEGVYTQKNNTIAQFFEGNNNEKLLSLIQELDIHELYPILDFAGWVLLFEEHPEVLKEFVKCFR
ncbi:MAG: winged helix-turn-helix transcriptional regulator [Candidatus Heimdallarchaeota archaeon]